MRDHEKSNAYIKQKFKGKIVDIAIFLDGKKTRKLLVLEFPTKLKAYRVLPSLSCAGATVVLFYFNEMSIKEIAKITGSFEGTVKTRLFAARKRLKKYLETDMESLILWNNNRLKQRESILWSIVLLLGGFMLSLLTL